MRLLKITVQVNREEGRTHYTYPQPDYDKLKIVFGPIYEGGMDKNCEEIWNRPGNTKDNHDEYILVGVLDNGKIEEVLQNLVFEEITEQECLDCGNRWTGVSQTITDQDKIIQILVKFARKELLTVQEENALNPENPELGINRSKTFQESLEEAKLAFPN